MWDSENGGFYWEVNKEGEVAKPNKHMYGQSFGLYSLSEFYKATEKEETKEFAVDFFDLLEEKAYDQGRGGYIEYFEPDWTPIETGQTYLEGIEPDWSPKESGDTSLDPTLKLMNTHLHLLEALTTFYNAFELPRSYRRLSELLTILTNTVVRKI